MSSVDEKSKAELAASDSDDDKPLASLIQKRKALQQANSSSSDNAGKKFKTEPTSSTTKVKVKEEKAKEVKSEKETTTKPKSSSSSSGSRKSAEFYETTEKGEMVQKLLCRWWYAIEWPKAEDIPPPTEGYESLDGFFGVFISTRSDSLGNIVDLRDKSTCPNLKNLSKWPSAKLQQTLIEAYEKQMEALKEHEGDDTKLYLSLRNELKRVKGFNPTKADQEAKKFSF